MFRFFIATYGCKVSQYESQALREYWIGLGGEETDDVSLADLVLAATCAVTAEAVSDARQAVRKWGRSAHHPSIIVTGCAATAAADDFRLTGVRAIVPQTSRHLLLEHHPLEELPALTQSLLLASDVQQAVFPPFRIHAFRRARPVVKIQDGCSHGCSYCIVPLTRGPARSRPVEDVIAEAHRLVRAGHRELMLSGINLRQYRYQGQDFWDLLTRLDQELAPEFAGVARLRLSSLEPAQLNARGLDCLASCRLLCPHLHLSLQSGSPSVLRRMGRQHYQPEDIIESLECLRVLWPVFGLGADILMGFPGESEEELEETLRMVQALPLTYAHVFPYSARPGTRAATMPGQLPKALRQEHARQVRDIVSRKQQHFLQEQALLPQMTLALDHSAPSGNSAENNGEILCISGINEYYTPCALTGEFSLKDHELVSAVPQELRNRTVVCTKQ